MDSTNTITLYGLLDYLYNRFAVTYLLCFLGVVIGQSLNIFTNKNKIPKPTNAFNISMQGALVTVILCALQDYITIKSMSTYVFLCTFLGIWSPFITKAITNIKVVKALIVNISKHIKDPLITAVSETIGELDENTDSDKKEPTSTDSKQQGDGT